ncbi:hypothetical protein [Clavibacter sp.]|uniref:hypothetical protein n=1 Tax=Clavibacter sp. TaxID=1871044 RepID=UPI001986B878|nr:hypothetical protein [Clavibacter sp.]MBD5381370.1 hypothetical protein [Clavibacter sp.]
MAASISATAGNQILPPDPPDPADPPDPLGGKLDAGTAKATLMALHQSLLGNRSPGG